MWTPTTTEPAAEQCKPYGAAAIMRIPTRLHITWQDDSTLKIETDAGTQTRVLRFGDTAIAAAEPRASPNTQSPSATKSAPAAAPRWSPGSF